MAPARSALYGGEVSVDRESIAELKPILLSKEYNEATQSKILRASSFGTPRPSMLRQTSSRAREWSAVRALAHAPL
jgi:hypothetical protein